MMSAAFLALLPQLITAIGATVAEVKGVINTAHPGMTDAELDAVLDLLIAKASQHKSLADADAKPVPA